MEVRKLKKKLIVLLMALTMAFSAVVSAEETIIKDIDKSTNYAKNAIIYLAQQKVISGDQNGNFNPQKPVTRGEMVALMAKAMNLDTSNTPATATFSDVPTNHWAAKYVEAAYKEGIVTGISTTEFKPNDKITREQMALMFVRALKIVDKDTEIEISNINTFSDKSKIATWAQKEVEVAIEAGLMTGTTNGKFEPKTVANKEQSAVVIERLMKNKEAITEAFKAQPQAADALKLALDKLVNNDFVGEMRSQGELKYTDKVTNAYSKSAFEMIDKMNDNYTSWSYFKDIAEMSGQEPQIAEYESIIIDKKSFEKDYADNKWTQTNLETGKVRVFTLFFDPIFEGEEISNLQMNEELLKFFDNIDVKKEGTVYISGVPATKYVMQFDAETIKNTMTEEDYVQVKDLADNIFQGKLNHRYEFYVANSNIIKQTFAFDGDFIDEETGNTVNYHSFTNIYYKNLGKKAVIAAPPASAIKAVTN